MKAMISQKQNAMMAGSGRQAIPALKLKNFSLRTCLCVSAIGNKLISFAERC